MKWLNSHNLKKYKYNFFLKKLTNILLFNVYSTNPNSITNFKLLQTWHVNLWTQSKPRFIHQNRTSNPQTSPKVIIYISKKIDWYNFWPHQLCKKFAKETIFNIWRNEKYFLVSLIYQLFGYNLGKIQ